MKESKRTYSCSVCNKEVSRGYTMCGSCSKRKPRPNCVDCGIQIRLHSKRCSPCHNKNQLTDHSSRAERTRFNNSSEWTFARTSCFERDSYTCVRCNVKGGTLNAHHMQEWISHPESRLDLNNLTTLCRTCHEHIHWRTKCGVFPR
jgi:5-methylcytosine-specific restriction endonuclease McrA